MILFGSFLLLEPIVLRRKFRDSWNADSLILIRYYDEVLIQVPRQFLKNSPMSANSSHECVACLIIFFFFFFSSVFFVQRDNLPWHPQAEKKLSLIQEQRPLQAAIGICRYSNAFSNLTIAYKIGTAKCVFTNFFVIDSTLFTITRTKTELNQRHISIANRNGHCSWIGDIFFFS